MSNNKEDEQELSLLQPRVVRTVDPQSNILIAGTRDAHAESEEREEHAEHQGPAQVPPPDAWKQIKKENGNE